MYIMVQFWLSMTHKYLKNRARFGKNFLREKIRLLKHQGGRPNAADENLKKKKTALIIVVEMEFVIFQNFDTPLGHEWFFEVNFFVTYDLRVFWVADYESEIRRSNFKVAY